MSQIICVCDVLKLLLISYFVFITIVLYCIIYEIYLLFLGKNREATYSHTETLFLLQLLYYFITCLRSIDEKDV